MFKTETILVICLYFWQFCIFIFWYVEVRNRVNAIEGSCALIAASIRLMLAILLRDVVFELSVRLLFSHRLDRADDFLTDSLVIWWKCSCFDVLIGWSWLRFVDLMNVLFAFSINSLPQRLLWGFYQLTLKVIFNVSLVFEAIIELLSFITFFYGAVGYEFVTVFVWSLHFHASFSVLDSFR